MSTNPLASLLGRLKTSVTVQPDVAAAPYNRTQAPVVLLRSRPRSLCGTIYTNLMAPPLRQLDRWAPTARSAVVTILLLGGVTAVSLLASAGAIAMSWAVGVGLSIPFVAVVTSSIRCAPSHRPGLSEYGGQHGSRVGSTRGDDSPRRETVHLNDW